jgi:hypothetical protein
MSNLRRIEFVTLAECRELSGRGRISEPTLGMIGFDRRQST